MSKINFDEIIQKLTVLEHTGHYMCQPCAGNSKRWLEKYSLDVETSEVVLERLESKIPEMTDIIENIQDDYSTRETKTLIQEAVNLLKNS